MALSLSSAARSAVRSAVASSEVALSRSATRGIHSTGVKKMGGDHGHGYNYEHSKHMYNLDRIKYRTLKMSLSVFTAFSIGVGVPVFAVVFQQGKTGSG